MFKDMGVSNAHAFFFDNVYIAPHMRFQPFLLGILFGYLLKQTRNLEIKLGRMINLMFWAISILFVVVLFCGTYRVRLNGYSMLETALYWGFARVGWCVSLSWVTFACTHGYGGVINNFLSNRLFIILSKLTYMMFMFHEVIHQLVTSSFVLQW